MKLGDNKEYNEGFSYTYLTILEVLNKVCKKNHIEITKIKTQPFGQDIDILYNMGYNYAIITVLDEINIFLKYRAYKSKLLTDRYL
jgi:hypothetical protein